MNIQNEQLSLFAPSPSPLTRSVIEVRCTELMIEGDRAALVRYLQGLCNDGYHWQITVLCRMRCDLGLRVVSGQVREFYRVGDLVRICKQGQFYGKPATIEALEGGIATVRGKTLSHHYSVADLRLITRNS